MKMEQINKEIEDKTKDIITQMLEQRYLIVSKQEEARQILASTLKDVDRIEAALNSLCGGKHEFKRAQREFEKSKGLNSLDNNTTNNDTEQEAGNTSDLH